MLYELYVILFQRGSPPELKSTCLKLKAVRENVV